MNKTKILLISAILIFFAASASAQSVQAIGQWRSYLPYNKGISVSQNEKFIFYASDFSLLSIDKSDMSVRRLSKVEGLSDVGISIVKHSPGGDVLVIVYSNGNIDLMSSEALINLPFLKNTEILGDRKIYNVSFAGPARAFISTGFGLLELNTTNATFLNDVRTGTPVFDVAVYEGFIYAATGEGIYRAADAPGVNLQDFSSNWVLLGSGEGFPDDFSSSDLLVYDDKLFLNIDNRLFTYQNGALNLFYEEAGYKINFLSSEGAHLLLGLDCQLSCWTDKVIAFDAAGNATMLSQNCTSSNSAFAVEDEKGQIWFADFDNQFRMLPAINAADCAFTTFDGPPTGNIWDMDVKNGVLWLATGGYSEQINYLYRSEGFLSYENGQWKHFNRNNREELRGENKDPNERDDDLFDIVAILGSEDGNTVFIGSYIEGLLEYDLTQDKMTLFNEKNSSLEEVAQNDPGRVRITGLAFDEEENLWITNFAAEHPLSMYKKDKSWQSFSLGQCGNFNEVKAVVVDEVGFKWIIPDEETAGVLVFDEGDPDDPADDRCRAVTTSNSNLPSNTAYSIAVDLDGDVWVGTEDGAIVFECGGSAFEAENCRGSLRPVEVGGDLEYLLKGENVRAIAVDGANRKWFGTTNGLFVQDAAGFVQVAAFNENNSPLFDNNIIDLAINQATGEVFIATNRGLQSFRTDAVEGGVINSPEVVVFPNPVRPDYEGPIAIKGLARDANVKITDIGGQLIYETTANGGQAIWDGKDYNGRRAATGVYLVFSTSTRNPDNPEAVVAKVLMVK